MARRRRYRRYSSYDAGSEIARRHIREAEQFSSEMGGTDVDVKEYFFGLSNKQLEPILVEYGKSHGALAEAYARETMPNWRSENRRMSGMIAKRLFSLLPPRMPLKKKVRTGREHMDALWSIIPSLVPNWAKCRCQSVNRTHTRETR